MSAYHIENTAVSPEEAVRIGRYMSMSTGFNVIPAFARAVVNLIPYEPIMGSQAVHQAEILMAIWTAGRIQGIREERKKRMAQRAKPSENAGLWKIDDEDIDDMFNNLTPSDQRYALITGMEALNQRRKAGRTHAA